MDFSLIPSPLRTFQSMVQCAINTSESIPKEELMLAFKTSISLLERIGELMTHNGHLLNNSSSGLLNNVQNIDQNSFLNSFTNPIGDNFCPNSSPKARHQESILFSNRMSFSNTDSIPVSCILPISSSQNFAAFNGLMRNGILSNNENLLNSRSISDENYSGPNSDNRSEINSPFLNLVKKKTSEQSVWHNRAVSPVSPLTIVKNESILSPVNLVRNPTVDRVPSRSRIEKCKNLNSDELNRLLDSCEIKTGIIGGKKNYKCKFCGKMYDIKSSIRYHIRIIHLKMHLKTADMQCKLCGRVFTCATAANKHQSRCLKITVSNDNIRDIKGSENTVRGSENGKEMVEAVF